MKNKKHYLLSEMKQSINFNKISSIMRAKYFFAALAVGALASCTSDEFVGENNNPTSVNENVGINFNGGREAMRRSSSDDDVTKLDGQFVVFGVKSGATAGQDMQIVFDHYFVWNKTDGAAANTTNKYGWEYVGTKWTKENDPVYGAASIKLLKDQTIKYWDLSAADYRFVAGSPVANFTFITDANKHITGATVTGIDAHMHANPIRGEGVALNHGAVYVATPIVLTPSDIVNTTTGESQAVKFEFTGQQALVRVGIYETIPGYYVSSINFYGHKGPGQGWADQPTTYHNIILNSLTDDDYFIGGKGMTAQLTYNWSGATPTYSFTYNLSSLSSESKSNRWYGGSFYNGVPCTKSETTTLANLYGTDKDMAQASGYFPVMPTATGVAPSALVVKCDYTLTSVDGSGETIEIKGATAAIPAAFAQWEVNHAYTYLFKISDKTAGTSGVLYPIQFDAAVVDGANNRDGFITTISTPSITSYQFKSPYTKYDSNGNFLETGIKYIANSDIYVTVQDNNTGDLKDLTAMTNYGAPETGNIQVYKLGSNEVTESDLQITRPAEDKKITTNIPAAAWNLHGKSFAAGKYMVFKPMDTGYYAIGYVQDATTNPKTYAYKVIKVEAE